jgi:bifunctional non-homologous end joining protein LigD
VAEPKANATFVPPMLLLPTAALPQGPAWSYELKLDGFRALAVKMAGSIRLRSRNDKDFNRRYPGVVRGLANLPGETVLDGEIVALDASGRPSFNTLQNFGSAEAQVFYYVFDVLVLAGRNLMMEPLAVRRELLERDVLPYLTEPVRHPPVLDAPLPELIEAVRAQGLEGLVAKRLDSRYEPGQRSGAWQKMRVNRGQEFVIGGYTPGPHTFDALIFGYYQDGNLIYAGRTRSGFTPVVRAQVHGRFRGLAIPSCPFVNLPEARSGRWGEGLTAEKMKECRWLRPELVGQFEFVEWTLDGHLRHARFIGLRNDKNARQVRRE